MSMEPEVCERTVGRVLAYLARSGVELTPAVLSTAFKIIEEALAQGGDGAVERALQALPRHFPPPRLRPPHAGPPIHRASIGYG